MFFRFIPLFPLALALATVPAAADAQAVVQPLPGTTDADRLADQVHRLAANPQDLDALVAAGALSIKLDDLTAAAAFFTRADKIDPRSARVKAGEASLLVRNERPGEALRYFAQAENYGLAPRAFAADRGLAYDLIGDQPRAQHDYRLALQQTPNDEETIRRYALSLGISGKKQQALDALTPLLTSTDRAAWRSRAFVLAMNGDIAGAEQIAKTMMPGGMAQGLLPFFQRLPTLDAIDRAFAVHFGEVRTSPERLADARLAPMTTPLPSETVAVAAVVSTPEPRKGRKDRRSRSVSGQSQAVQAAPAQVASAMVPAASTSTPPPPPPPPVVAAVSSPPTPAPPVFGPSVAVVQAVPVGKHPTSDAASAAPLPTPGFAALVGTAAHRTASRRPHGEDAVLDRIMAGLSIPASELGVAPAPSPGDQPERTPAERRAADRKTAAAAKALAAKKAAAEAKIAADKEAAKEAAAERKAARSNPARIWVQVAGGANEDDLPKAWAAVKRKAPEVFAGRSGWKTPLRATNRVLAGPFKTDADARAFVNALGKSGVSGFTFTSDKGQKIEKLPTE